jgi:hypothetical protein
MSNLHLQRVQINQRVGLEDPVRAAMSDFPRRRG